MAEMKYQIGFPDGERAKRRFIRKFVRNLKHQLYEADDINIQFYPHFRFHATATGYEVIPPPRPMHIEYRIVLNGGEKEKP